MASNSINQFLEAYLQQDIYPLHMPGHKRNPAWFSVPGEHFCQGDITEIEGADNLLHPTGVIQSVQQRMATFYGALETFMLVNGSSAGLLAAVMGVCNQGDGLLMARNCHMSVYNGVILAGAKPVYVAPEMTGEAIAGGIAPEAIEQLLNQNPHVRAVVITSPTFEGFCSHVQAIARIVHQQGKVLIVDEAHGAHFGLHPAFPASAVKLGADIVVQSMHKTLPALNQSALLHVCSSRVDARRLKRCLAMVQTTSPSYLLLAQMEHCLCRMEQEGPQLFDGYVQLLEHTRQALAPNQSIRLLGKDMAGTHSIVDVDMGKLVFAIHSNAINGVQLAKQLRNEARVELEMSGLHHALAMTSVADTPEGLQRLVDGIQRINDRLPYGEKENHAALHGQLLWGNLAYTPREAVFQPETLVPLEESINRIASGFVIPYPPGIPAIVPGETITPQTVAYIQACMDNGIAVVGLEDGCLPVINEKETF